MSTVVALRSRAHADAVVGAGRWGAVPMQGVPDVVGGRRLGGDGGPPVTTVGEVVRQAAGALAGGTPPVPGPTRRAAPAADDDGSLAVVLELTARLTAVRRTPRTDSSPVPPADGAAQDLRR